MRAMRAAGEGSLLSGVLACGDTLSPTLSRKRERERSGIHCE
ncbi:hypothetical protein V1280_003738 [Bradyrhizobium sp. AZCC 2230]